MVNKTRWSRGRQCPPRQHHRGRRSSPTKGSGQSCMNRFDERRGRRLETVTERPQSHHRLLGRNPAIRLCRHRPLPRVCCYCSRPRQRRYRLFSVIAPSQEQFDRLFASSMSHRYRLKRVWRLIYRCVSSGAVNLPPPRLGMLRPVFDNHGIIVGLKSHEHPASMRWQALKR